MVARYMVRYRSTDAARKSALILDDGQGAAYLYAAGTLQLRTQGEQPCERLARLLGGATHWELVPDGTPRSLDALLSAAAPAGNQVASR